MKQSRRGNFEFTPTTFKPHQHRLRRSMCRYGLYHTAATLLNSRQGDECVEKVEVVRNATSLHYVIQKDIFS